MKQVKENMDNEKVQGETCKWDNIIGPLEGTNVDKTYIKVHNLILTGTSCLLSPSNVVNNDDSLVEPNTWGWLYVMRRFSFITKDFLGFFIKTPLTAEPA